MDKLMEERDEKGFTLIELLVAIVVVGILAAVAIVGIAGLTDTAKAATCSVTMDSARAGATSYYAAHNIHTYPTTFDQMIHDTPNPDLVLQGGVQNPGAGNTLTDNSNPVKWTITLGANGALSASGTDAASCV